MLTITSTPAGAAVYLDSGLLGTTPLNRIRVKDGRHTLRLSLTGYLDATDDFTILCDSTSTKSYTLLPVVTTTPTTPIVESVRVAAKVPANELVPANNPSGQGSGNAVPAVRDAVPAGGSAQQAVPAQKKSDTCFYLGKSDCSGECVDLNTDRYNCGSCGNRCIGVPCTGGVCGEDCPAGKSDCGLGCVDLISDPQNCGSCGTVCSEGTGCCEGKCIGIIHDIYNCGSCNNFCAGGKDTACCNGKCVNVTKDVYNCGGCGNFCLGGSACCQGSCTNIISDTANCGSCGHQCFPCQICDQFSCKNLPADAPHPAGCEPYITLLFVPLNWEGDQKSFDDAVDTQVQFFTGATPLKDCPQRIGVQKLNVNGQNFVGFTCDNDLDRILDFVGGIGIDADRYTYIIGLIQKIPCPKTAGRSNKRNCIWHWTGADSGVAHELGHIYGLSDEYCSNPAGSKDCRCNDGDRPSLLLQQSGISSDFAFGGFNCMDHSYDGAETGDRNWLDAGLGCDPNVNGGCCTNCIGVNYGGCCSGNNNNLGGKCVMAPADAAAPRAYCPHCRDWLATIPNLQCHSPPLPLNRTIVDMRVSVHPDDTVTVEKILLTDGIPDVNYQRGTAYEFRTIDSHGATMWNTTMDIYFDYDGPVLTGVDYSGIRYSSFPIRYRIPYDNSMQKFELYHNGTLIFSADLNFCNNNGVCDTTETHKTCPADCPLNRKDGVCTKAQDTVCDPDCLPGVDPDCSAFPLIPLSIGGGLIIVAGVVMILYFRKKRGA